MAALALIDACMHDIYLLSPPNSIFPNFISLIKPKAMHAYHPKYAHQKGDACIVFNRYKIANTPSVEDP